MAVNSKIRSAGICVVAVSTAYLAAFTAAAQVVSFGFRGQVTSRQDPTGYLSGGFEVGSEMTGRVSFDVGDAPSDAYPNDPGFALYSFPSSVPFVLEISAGAHAFTGYWGVITIQNAMSAGPGADIIGYQAVIKSYDGVVLAPTFSLFGYGITLDRTTPPLDVLPNDQLPTTAPRLSDFDYGTIAISATDPTRGIDFTVYGTVNEITPIPEPSSGTFLIAGILTLVVLRLSRGALHQGSRRALADGEERRVA
jgi:hypothetical protein